MAHPLQGGREMSKANWKRRRYVIATGNPDQPHMKAVRGPVWSCFGLRREGAWVTVTHTPSGYVAGRFATYPQAKLYCETIARMAKWNTITPKRLDRSPRLCAAVKSVMESVSKVRP